MSAFPGHPGALEGPPIDYTEEDLVAAPPVPAPAIRDVAWGGPRSPHPALTRLAVGGDVHRFTLTSDRPLARWTVLPAKRLLRRLLHPVFARQVEFNIAVSGALDTVWNQVEELRAAHDAAFRRTSALELELTASRQAAEAIEARLELLERRLETPPPRDASGSIPAVGGRSAPS